MHSLQIDQNPLFITMFLAKILILNFTKRDKIRIFLPTNIEINLGMGSHSA